MSLKASLIVLVAVAASFGSVAQTPPPAGAMADTIAIGGVAVPTIAVVVGGLILAAAIVSAINSDDSTATATATATAP